MTPNTNDSGIVREALIREALIQELGLTMAKWKSQLNLLEIPNKETYSPEEAEMIRAAFSIQAGNGLALPSSSASVSTAVGADSNLEQQIEQFGSNLAGRHVAAAARGYVATAQRGVTELKAMGANFLNEAGGGAAGADPLEGARAVFQMALEDLQ